MDYHAYLHKLWVSGIMESVESNNFYRLGTTLTTGHLAKLHLAVSQSLLAQELMGCAWNQTTFTTYRQLAQLFGFAWNQWNQWNHWTVTRSFLSLFPLTWFKYVNELLS